MPPGLGRGRPVRNEGVSPMVHASASKSKPGRGRALFLGALLLAGLFGLIQLAAAQNTTKDKPAKDKTVGKGLDKQPAKFTALKLTIASKDADVPEVKKLIDEKIRKGWEENKVTPAPFCDDYEFIRRASLDIIGRIAKPEEIDRYLKDPPDRRRSELIERLLKSDDY